MVQTTTCMLDKHLWYCCVLGYTMTQYSHGIDLGMTQLQLYCEITACSLTFYSMEYMY